jgi:hypothetical protein
MRRPIFAASALRESGATVVAEAAGCFGAAGAPEVAMAAVLMPRTAAAPTVVPIAARRDSFIKGCLLRAAERISLLCESFGALRRDEGTVELRRPHVNVLF